MKNRLAFVAIQSSPLRRPESVLVFMTLLWGATFLITRTALAWIDPYLFVGFRFGIAGLVILLVTRPRLGSFTRRDLSSGALIGVALFAGYGLQADGLRTVASGQSAFLTALYVPMVPILEFVLFRRLPSLGAGMGIGLAFIGLILISGSAAATLHLDAGEWITLGGALGAALEIVLIGHFAHGTEPRRIALVQVVVTSFLAFGIGLARGGHAAFAAPGLVACIAVMGLGTALIMVAQNWAQSSVPANRATVIYTLEPVWAGIFGAAFGEDFSASQILGAAIIIASVLLSQWRR